MSEDKEAQTSVLVFWHGQAVVIPHRRCARVRCRVRDSRDAVAMLRYRLALTVAFRSRPVACFRDKQ